MRSMLAQSLPIERPPDTVPPELHLVADIRLTDIPLREVVELIRIDMPSDQIEPLLERGVLPGCLMCPVRYSPSGDPIVRVDGSLLALRREMAGCFCVRRADSRTN